MTISGDPEGVFSFATAGCMSGQSCAVPFTINPGAPPGSAR
jgi:hypothetical protein